MFAGSSHDFHCKPLIWLRSKAGLGGRKENRKDQMSSFYCFICFESKEGDYTTYYFQITSGRIIQTCEASEALTTTHNIVMYISNKVMDG